MSNTDGNNDLKFGYRHAVEISIILALVAGSWDASIHFVAMADLGYYFSRQLQLGSGSILSAFALYLIYITAGFAAINSIKRIAKFSDSAALTALYSFALMPICVILCRNFGLVSTFLNSPGVNEKTYFYFLKNLWIFIPIAVGFSSWLTSIRMNYTISRIGSVITSGILSATIFLVVTPWIMQRLVLGRANVTSVINTTLEDRILTFGLFGVAVIVFPLLAWIFNRIFSRKPAVYLLVLWVILLFLPYIGPIFTEESNKGTDPSGNELSGNPVNFILVSFDTTRFDDLAIFGSDIVKTPNFDRFGQKSLLFDNAVAPMPLTGPSHMSMLTGLQPDTEYGHRIKTNGIQISDQIPTLTSIADEAGYRTCGVIGGYPLNRVASGLQRGFHTYYDKFDESWFVKFMPEQFWNLTSMKIIRKLTGLRPNQERTLMKRADKISDQAIGWLEKNDDEPFFMFTHYFDAHYTYIPPGDYSTMYMPGYNGKYKNNFSVRSHLLKAIPTFTQEDHDYFRASYRGEISYMDSQFGRLLDYLDEENLWDNTMVIVVADHGESFEHNYYFNHNARVYNQLIHVPMMVYYPGIADRAGERVESVVCVSDIFYTAMNFLGLPTPRTPDEMNHGIPGAIQGWDHVLTNIGSGTPTWNFVPSQSYNLPSEFYVESGRFFSFRFRNHQLIYGPDAENEIEAYEFFDLTADPNEEENIFVGTDWVNIENLDVEEDFSTGHVPEVLKIWSEAQESNTDISIDPQQMDELEALGYIGN
ncbi:MAG TPA: sulfatase [bacterium]